MVALARHPHVIDFARALVRPARGRLARIAVLFTFVAHLVDVPAPPDDGVRDGADALLRLCRGGTGPAVALCALLQAIGERAQVRWSSGLAFVRVEIEPGDIARLPPHARLLSSGGRYYLPLDARGARRPLGLLPRPLPLALARQRPPAR
jgi:hypothetical protein